MVEVNGNQIHKIASRELIQSFDLKTLQAQEEGLNSHIEVLDQLYQRLSTSCQRVSVAINAGMVIIKKIPLALGLDDKMTKDQILWEVDQLLLSPIDLYSIEYERLPNQTPSGNPNYLVVLIQKKILEIIQSLIKQTGLHLANVDVDIFANIRNLLVNYQIDKESTVVFVDTHDTYIDLVLLRQKDYFLSHRISFNTIRSDSGVLSSKDVVKHLIKEIRRLIFGHRLGRKIEDIECIFLLGGKLIQKISEILPSEVSVPIEIVNPFRKINVSPSVTQSKEWIQFPHRFMPSVGMLLKNNPSLAEA